MSASAHRVPPRRSHRWLHESSRPPVSSRPALRASGATGSWAADAGRPGRCVSTSGNSGRLGVGPATIVGDDAMAGGGSPVVHGVCATFTGPLPRPSRIAAALLYGGAAAVLSHRTAAEEWSLLPPSDGPVHITVPYGSSAISPGRPRHRPPLPGVPAHRRRAPIRRARLGPTPLLTSRSRSRTPGRLARCSRRLHRHRGSTAVDVERRLRASGHPVGTARRWRPPSGWCASGVLSALEELYALEVEQAHGLPPRAPPGSVCGRRRSRCGRTPSTTTSACRSRFGSTAARICCPVSRFGIGVGTTPPSLRAGPA